MSDEQLSDTSYFNDGVPVPVVVMLILGLFAATAGAIYYAQRVPDPNQNCVVQNETQRKNAEAQLEANKNVRDVQMRVVEGCLKKDGIPMFQGGNVVCSIQKKEGKP